MTTYKLRRSYLRARCEQILALREPLEIVNDDLHVFAAGRNAAEHQLPDLRLAVDQAVAAKAAYLTAIEDVYVNYGMLGDPAGTLGMVQEWERFHLEGGEGLADLAASLEQRIDDVVGAGVDLIDD